MLGIVGAVLNAVVLVVGLAVKLVTAVAKMLTGLVRSIVPGRR